MTVSAKGMSAERWRSKRRVIKKETKVNQANRM
jgi:hypothetical protein